MDNKKKKKNSLLNDNKINLLLKRNEKSGKDNNNNNNNNKKSGINRIGLLTLMGLIIITGIILFYFVFNKDVGETYKVGFSYTPTDITNIDINPPIDTKVENINQCVKECELNGNCSGITFNKDTYKCKGYKDGMLIKTSPNMYAWQKPRSKKKKESLMILLSNTYQQTTIDAGKIAYPYQVYNFNFSFWLNIIDWYNSTHGYWKCVFFKSSIDNLNNKYKEISKHQDWKKIVDELPNQCIGVWLSPFTNNLRICVTTEINENNDNKTSLPHPNKQICVNNVCLYTNELSTKNVDKDKYPEHIKKMNDYIKENDENTQVIQKPNNQGKIEILNNNNENNNKKLMEHFDLLDVPIGESFFISINLNKSIMNIHINGKLNHIINLEGRPIFNNNNLNIKNNPTFNGNIYNISYLPYFASIKEINNLYKIKPPKKD